MLAVLLIKCFIIWRHVIYIPTALGFWSCKDWRRVSRESWPACVPGAFNLLLLITLVYIENVAFFVLWKHCVNQPFIHLKDEVKAIIYLFNIFVLILFLAQISFYIDIFAIILITVLYEDGIMQIWCILQVSSS